MSAGEESSPLDPEWRVNTLRMNASSWRFRAAVKECGKSAKDENCLWDSSVGATVTCWGSESEELLGKMESLVEAGTATAKGGGVDQRSVT